MMKFKVSSKKGRNNKPLFKIGVDRNKIAELTSFLFNEYLADRSGLFSIDGQKMSSKCFVIAYAFVLVELGIVQRNINVVAYREFMLRSIGEEHMLSHQAYSSIISKVKLYGMSFHELDECIINAKQNQLNYMNLELWQLFKNATSAIMNVLNSSEYKVFL